MRIRQLVEVYLIRTSPRDLVSPSAHQVTAFVALSFFRVCSKIAEAPYEFWVITLLGLLNVVGWAESRSVTLDDGGNEGGTGRPFCADCDGLTFRCRIYSLTRKLLLSCFEISLADTRFLWCISNKRCLRLSVCLSTGLSSVCLLVLLSISSVVVPRWAVTVTLWYFNNGLKLFWMKFHASCACRVLDMLYQMLSFWHCFSISQLRSANAWRVPFAMTFRGYPDLRKAARKRLISFEYLPSVWEARRIRIFSPAIQAVLVNSGLYVE